MTEDCKSIILLSNGPSANSKENSLSIFSNSIPPNYLAKHKRLQVAVHSLGINLDLVNDSTLSPASKRMPDLFQITRENWASCVGSYDNIKELAISMFETKCALKLYADKNMHYTPESLYHHFSTQTINHYSDNSKPNNPMPVKFHQESGYISFGQFSYDGKEQNPPRDSRTYLLFSKRLKDCLDISLEDDSQCSNEFKERKDLVDLVDLYCDDSGEYVFTPDWDEYTIDGETYYRLYNARLYKKRRFYPFTSKKKNFHTANPTLLRIIYANIEYAICGGSYD